MTMINRFEVKFDAKSGGMSKEVVFARPPMLHSGRKCTKDNHQPARTTVDESIVLTPFSCLVELSSLAENVGHTERELNQRTWGIRSVKT